MRILHAIHSMNPDMGGLPKTAAALPAAQALAGADVGLLYYATTGEERRIEQTYGTLPGFRLVHRMPVTPCPPGEWLFNRKALQHAAGFRPDILHTHGLWEPLLRNLHAWARDRHIPYVILPQSMLHPWQNRHRKTAKFMLKHLLGWSRLWAGAAFWQALTAAEKQHLEEQRVCERIARVPNGVFASEADEHTARPLDAIFPFLRGRPYVVSMARLHPQKGLDVLVDAFAQMAGRLPDLCLVLAGADYGQGPQLRATVQQAGLDDRVFFPGLLPQAVVWPALAGARAFCLPSRAEGFSLALLEAALAGAPLIITPGCLFDELAAAGAARLVPLEAGRLADALHEVASNPSARDTMGAAGRRLVLEHYTWDAVARRLLALYASGKAPA